MHDVAVLHYIILALDRELACLTHSSLRTVLHVVVVLDYLGADEALLEVGVDDAGTLRSLPALVVCPRLHLHLAGGDECLQVEQVVSLLYETVHAALLKTQLLKEHLLVLVSLERCDVLLGLRSDDEHLRTLVLCYLRNLLRVLVAALCRRLVYVAHVEHGLGGEQEEVVSVALLLLRLELYAACVLSLLQHFLVSLKHRHGYLGVLVVANGCYLRLLLQLRLYGLEVLQLKLGIDNLLEGILLQAELLELSCNNQGPAIGSVIEAKLDKKEGAKATLLVQNGSLHLGDYLAIGSLYCKVRRMTNEFNKPVKVATPSTPVVVTGISGVPIAGDRFMAFPSESEARIAGENHSKNAKNDNGISLQNISNDESISSINLLLKTDTQGSLEAVLENLKSISVEGASLKIVHAGTGDITQSDVVLAEASKAIIIAFNLKVSSTISDLSKEKKIEIRSYDVIYHLQEDIENALKGTLAPTYEEVIYGRAEVNMLFKASKVGQIAGCMVIDGKIPSSSKIRVYRKGELILETSLASLKRFNDDVKEVTSGFDCGLTIKDKLNLEEKDILEAYGKEIVNG